LTANCSPTSAGEGAETENPADLPAERIALTPAFESASLLLATTSTSWSAAEAAPGATSATLASVTAARDVARPRRRFTIGLSSP
jgi:hypothetical protein